MSEENREITRPYTSEKIEALLIKRQEQPETVWVNGIKGTHVNLSWGKRKLSAEEEKLWVAAIIKHSMNCGKIKKEIAARTGKSIPPVTKMSDEDHKKWQTALVNHMEDSKRMQSREGTEKGKTPRLSR